MRDESLNVSIGIRRWEFYHVTKRNAVSKQNAPCDVNDVIHHIVKRVHCASWAASLLECDQTVAVGSQLRQQSVVRV